MDFTTLTHLYEHGHAPFIKPDLVKLAKTRGPVTLLDLQSVPATEIIDMIKHYASQESQPFGLVIRESIPSSLLLYIRNSLDIFPQRPFVIREVSSDATFQAVLEARLNGADSVYLSSANGLTRDLMEYIRSLGMEPFVKSKEASLNAILVVAEKIPGSQEEPTASIVFVEDQNYAGHKLVPIASGTKTLRSDISPKTNNTEDKIVKVCGIRTLEAAKRALDAGADMLGMIMVPGRDRTVPNDIARQISDMVHEYRENINNNNNVNSNSNNNNHSTYFDQAVSSLLSRRPLLVGVFRNQPLEEILYLQKLLNLDIVQLHGSEPVEWCSLIPVPVIKRFTPGTSQFVESLKPGHHVISLLDGEIGGEGKLVDWDVIEEAAKKGGRFMLAGGLNPDNVAKAISIKGVIGVDVSGGVETNGGKDFEKIDNFVKNAKNAIPQA